MGEVFRAIAVGEHGFEKPVVVKRVLPAHSGREDLSDLFVAEAKLMTRLSHPNIVEVLDFGRGEHRDYYLVLELVDGTDLGRLMRALHDRREPFPVPLALFVASQVLRGLHHAHTRETGGAGVIVHRDVSPSNVLCSAEGEVKVADFGVALVAGAGAGRPESVAGKPAYMAPEQFSPGPIDPRADLFSVGVVMHQMLTGELPFQGDTAELQEAARRAPCPRVRALRGEVSEAVDGIVAKALAFRPDDRFADARAMAQAIEGLRDQGERIATGDDLAERVRAAQRDLAPLGRPVIPLSGRPSADQPDDDAPRELTRSGGGGAFTLRFPAPIETSTARRVDVPDRWSAPEPRTERIDPVEPVETNAPESESAEPPTATALAVGGPAPPPPALRTSEARATPAPLAPTPSRAGARVALGLVAVVVVLGAAASSLRSPRGRAVSDGPPLAPETSASPSAQDEPPAPSAAPVVTATVSATPSAHVRIPLARLAASAAPSAPALVSAIAATSAPAAASASAGCRGDVAFYSNQSWTILGGPSPVQTPHDRVEWPCGTYGLTARSRFDQAQVRTVSVTVSPAKRAVVDLR
jgi:serine/threonine-protein kinase